MSSYSKTSWLDRVVQFPRRYLDQLLNQYTFTPDEGTITEAGTAVTAARMNKIEQGVYDADLYGADAGGDDTYVLNLSTTLATGMQVRLKVTTGNTGACTLSIDNGATAKTIKKHGTQDLETGDIIAGQVITVAYDGTNWQLMSPTKETGVLTTRGDVLVKGAAGNDRLAVGANGKILKSDGTDPVWGDEGTSVITARGDLLTRNASALARLAIGANGKILKSDGSDPSWQDESTAVMTARGDLLARGASGLQRLALGSAGQIVASDGTDVAWSWFSNQGSYSETTSVTASSTYAKNIALGFSPKRGRLIINGQGGYGSAIVFFGTLTSQAVAVSFDSNTSTVGNVITTGLGASNITAPLFGESGYEDKIRIYSVRINGTNLEIIFQNVDTSDRAIAATIRWECEIG